MIGHNSRKVLKKIRCLYKFQSNVSGAYGGIGKLASLRNWSQSVKVRVLSTPTIVDTIDTIIDTIDTIDTGLIRSRKKGVLVVQGNKTYVSLGNYHHTFFLS